jgi:adenylate cyclase
MRLSRFFIGFFVIITLLAGLDLYISVLLDKAQRDIETAQDRFNRSVQLSDELRSSSEYLTRFARKYAISLDERFARYYQLILDIRDGKIAAPDNYDSLYWDLVAGKLLPEPMPVKEGARSLEDKLLAIGLSASEFNLLKEGKLRSDNLGHIEQLAMNVARGKYDDGIGKFEKKGKPDREKAISLLNDENYNIAKAQIMSPIATFISEVKSNNFRRIQDINSASDQLVRINTATMAAMLASITIAVFVFFSRFVGRGRLLLRTIGKLENGDFSARTDVSGNDEIGTLARAINGMAAKIDGMIGSLRQEVTKAEAYSSELQVERNRSEKLLNNILPAVIANRLRNGEGMIAETFQEVTVLFADIVGFTEISAKLGPQGTVSMLNDIFGRFDEIAEKYGLEKIKTIGDCYMVVGGVPKRDPLHCQHIMFFAIDAIKIANDYSQNFPIPIKIRVGVHTGTVVAGVVGKRKFSFDLWGDVVNVASRFEASGVPNRVHVSDTVRSRLIEDFDFEDGGVVTLKGKGEVKSSFLIGPRAGYEVPSADQTR